MKFVSILGALALTSGMKLNRHHHAQNIQLEESKVEEMLPNFHGYTPEYSGFEGNNHNDG